MSKIFRRTLFLFLIISFYVPAQDILDLESAVSLTLKNNYSILVARNELEITENNASLGSAGFLPRIDADAGFLRSRTNSDQEYFDGRKIERDNAVSENLTLGLSLNWTIFDGLRMFASLDRLKKLRESGQTRLKFEIENNISSVIKNYFDIVRIFLRMEVLERTLAVSEERVRIAESKKEVGSGSKFELLQARVDLNEDRSAYLDEELRLSDAKSNLNLLMGREPAVDFMIKDSIILTGNFIFEDLKELIKTNNSEILLAEQSVNIAALDINIARSDFFPRIDLTGGYDYIRSESESGLLKSNRTSGFNYGVVAFLNLFDGLNTRIRTENSQIIYENSKIVKQESLNRVESLLFNTYKNYRISLEVIELEAENYAAAEENASIALERLRLGSITPLEFREAQIDLLNAQHRLVNSRYAAKTAETELLRLTGQLILEVP